MGVFLSFLASPDALEVMWVSDLLSVSTDLTDVTLVIDGTYWRLDWCYSSNEDTDEDDEDDEEDLSDVTLESDDTYWKFLLMKADC